METQSRFPFAHYSTSTDLSCSSGYPVRNHHTADGCRNFKDAGQTYARRHHSTEAFSGMDAIMYSWYFARLTGTDHDHVHDWQTVIVWFNGTGDKPENYNINAYSRSTHDGYRSATPDQLYEGHQILRYTPKGLGFFEPKNRDEAKTKGNLGTSTVAPPLFAWESLQTPHRDAFNNVKNFGGYVAPFAGDERDPKSSFNVHLGAAWAEATQSGPRVSTDV